jgi:hypothetical protein
VLSAACGGSDEPSVVVPIDAGDAGASGGASGSGGSSATGGSGGTGGSSASGGSSGSSGTDAGGTGGGAPIPCNSAGACPTGLMCDPLTKICVQCLFDNQCAIGQRCASDRTCRDVIDCTNSLACVGAAFNETICDQASGRCVECLSNSDCGSAEECVDTQCVAYLPCVNSLDCRGGWVCDVAGGRCVECLGDADCGVDRQCENRKCWSNCNSDTVCTPQGLLCDRTAGHCTRCLSHVDCPTEYYCASGQCELDNCIADTKFCNANTLVSCTPEGDRNVSTPCGSRQSCVTNNGVSSCLDWACTAGATECDPITQEAVTCSADGLTVLSRVDCTTTNRVCYNGQCQSLLCQPNTRFCDNGQPRQCSSNGLSATALTPCTSSQYCDDATGTCLTRLCTPNQVGCDGTRVATCNALGSGWINQSTDCATLAGMQCLNGACVCQTGRADCTSVAGCETNVSTSLTDCGGCGATCSTQNIVTPICSGGVCSGTCVTGYSNCDNDLRTNGCERATSTDTQNCGACNRICSSLNITATCTGGVCNGTCNTGFADCNSNKQTDGCERNVDTDPNNCGGCALSCSSTNMATRTCTTGNCDGTCVSGFADCDNNKRSNGCEINTKTSSQNCGGCGAPCATGEFCVNGVCGACNSNVLLLCDGLCSATSNVTIKNAFDGAGLITTTVDNGINLYSGTPAASGFGAVVLPVGQSYSTDMPTTGQTSIVNAQAAGTGAVFTEWASFHPSSGRWTTGNLRSLLLLSYSSSATGSVTYTLTSAGHPIWDTLPTSFTTNVTSLNHLRTGSLVNGGVAIANWTQSTITSTGVAVRDTTGGRLVHIAHSAAYSSATWYNDANQLKMLSNAARWATRCF